MSFLADLRAVIRERDFRRLYATRLISQTSDGVFQVALASYVFFSPERSTSADKAAAAFAALLLPYSIVGPFAGVFLDRWRRRQVLVSCNVVRALLGLVVTALVAAGQEGLAFYLTALALISVNRFFLAALSASLPHVVRPRDLVMANSVSTTSGTIAAVTGALVGFVVRELLGREAAETATVVMLSSCVYLCAALVASRMDKDLLGPDYDTELPETREALRRVARGLVDGGRHVWHHRAAGQALAAIGVHRFFYGVSLISTILLYRNYFNEPWQVQAGLGGLAMVFAASGFGYFVAALITPEVTRRMSTSAWVTSCLTAAAVVQLVFGLPYLEVTLVLGAFLLGVVAQATKICVDTIVQESIDDAYRGRVFSFYDVLFNVSFVSAALFAALALPPSGRSYPVLVFVAVGYGLTSLGYGFARRRAGDARPSAVG
ncbi:MAG: MFS transporter [Carbonactinosporaceae bacterium]